MDNDVQLSIKELKQIDMSSVYVVVLTIDNGASGYTMSICARDEADANARMEALKFAFRDLD